MTMMQENQRVLRTTSGQFVAATESGHFAAIPRPREGTPHAPVLDDDELARVFELITDPRNRAMLTMMAGAGLRMADVCLLDLSSLVTRDDRNGGLALLPAIGDDAARLVRLPYKVFVPVSDYVQHSGRSLGQSGPLFLRREVDSATGASLPMLRQHVALVVMRSLYLAGIEIEPLVSYRRHEGTLTVPEILRYTFVARFVRGGGELVDLQRILGHQSLGRTARYVDRIVRSIGS